MGLCETLWFLFHLIRKKISNWFSVRNSFEKRKKMRNWEIMCCEMHGLFRAWVEVVLATSRISLDFSLVSRSNCFGNLSTARKRIIKMREILYHFEPWKISVLLMYFWKRLSRKYAYNMDWKKAELERLMDSFLTFEQVERLLSCE